MYKFVRVKLQANVKIKTAYQIHNRMARVYVALDRKQKKSRKANGKKIKRIIMKVDDQ